MAGRLSVGDLTRRQKEVCDLLVRGYSNAEIAERLGISLDGAKWHVRELIGKLGVESRDEVADAWEQSRRRDRWGWVSGLGGLASLKIGAGMLATAVAVGGVLVAASLGSGGDDAEVFEAVQVAGTPTPTATTPPFPFPQAPGSIFTAQEALDVALREAERYLRHLDRTLVDPLEPRNCN